MTADKRDEIQRLEEVPRELIDLEADLLLETFPYRTVTDPHSERN